VWSWRGRIGEGIESKGEKISKDRRIECMAELRGRRRRRWKDLDCWLSVAKKKDKNVRPIPAIVVSADKPIQPDHDIL
jgi:hypothetical protein